MKWIGQHIYDQISRFRNSVYLEDISTGTIASGGNLGLDSNNKIVKATSTSHDQVTLAGTPDYITISGQEITRNAIDLATDVTGVLPSANMDTDTAHLSGNQTFSGLKTFGVGGIFSKAIRSEGNRASMLNDGTAIHVDAQDITDQNTSASGTAALFRHVSIENPRLLATNASVTTTDASTLYIAGAPAVGTNQTITNTYAIHVDGGLVKFDESLTVGGTLTMGSTAAMTNAGLLSVANQSNITGVGTLSSGDATGIVGDASTSAKGIAVFHTSNFAASSGSITIKDGGVDLTSKVVGVLPSANMDADTAHLTTDQTFTGIKTFNEAINKKSLHFVYTAVKFASTTATETYFSLADSDRDQPTGSEDGVAVMMICPLNGILKHVIINTSSNLSTKTWEFRLYRVPSAADADSGGEIKIATVASNAGPASHTNKVISFVSATADTNVITYETGYDAETMFTAGDRVLFSLESNSDAAGSPKINATLCFELDESTI